MVPEDHDSATVLFTDIVNFTPLAGKLFPKQIFEFLSAIYTEFDAVVKNLTANSIEVCKVETIGSYLNLTALVRALSKLKPAHNMAFHKQEEQCT